MPKMKSRTTAKKRFTKTKSGLIKRAKAFKRHLLTSKTAKRKRNLRKSAIVASVDARAIRKLIAAR